jgi:hypothetical protein
MLMAVCDFARPRVLVNFGMFSPAFWVSFFSAVFTTPQGHPLWDKAQLGRSSFLVFFGAFGAAV